LYQSSSADEAVYDLERDSAQPSSSPIEGPFRSDDLVDDSARLHGNFLIVSGGVIRLSAFLQTTSSFMRSIPFIATSPSFGLHKHLLSVLINVVNCPARRTVVDKETAVALQTRSKIIRRLILHPRRHRAVTGQY
jgi:hypothetical protein